jgi:hypothetical protein
LRLRTVKEMYERRQTFTLYPLGDMHYGSANCDVDKLKRVVGRIAADPSARWIGMGDAVESIAPNDKRWKAGGMTPEVVENQDRIGDFFVDSVSDILFPIREQLWSYGSGNHEEVFNTRYYTDLSVRILERIKRPECYTGWAAMTRVQFVEGNHRSSLKVFHSHGWQAGRMDGAKVNQLDYLMGYIDGCDIYLQGHSHSVLVKSKAKLAANQKFNDLTARTCYGAHTGSFLKTYEFNQVGYGERDQYPPTKLGTIRFLLHPSEDGVKIEAIQ